MLIQSEQLLHDLMKERDWFIMDRKLGINEGTEVHFKWDPKTHTCLGAYLRLCYTDGHVNRVLIPFEHYHNIRSYVESVWAEEGVLRLIADSKIRKLCGNYSVPTKGLSYIEWWYWYGPRTHLGDPDSFCFSYTKRTENGEERIHVPLEQAIDLAYDNLGPGFSFRI